MSTGKIEDFVKYHGAHIVNFLQKNVDVIIMDYSLLRKAPVLSNTMVTRSQQLIKKSNKKSGSSSIKSFAEKWKIPIIDHRKVLHHCKTNFCKEELSIECSKKLLMPFIKMEDQSRKYRPEFVEFKIFPFIDTAVPLPHSPFDTWYKQNAIGNRDLITERKNQLHFCGLCNKTYGELQSHLDGAEHKLAAKDDARFAGVDALIKQGASLEDFVKKMTEKRDTIM